MQLEEAIRRLDPANDDHWTMQGLPRMDALEIMVGNPNITRGDVEIAVPGMTREMAQASAPLAGQTPGAPPASPVVDPRAAYFPEPEPEPEIPEKVLGKKSWSDIFRSHDLVLVAMTEIQEKFLVALQERDKAQQRINELSHTNELLKNADRHFMRRGSRKDQTESTRRYIEDSNKQRADRAALARQAMGELKMPIAELVKQISPAPVDAVRARMRRSR